MRRTYLLLFSTAIALLLASGAVLALPSEKPDDTPMVDGRVRAIEQVATNIWVGGRFSRVEQRNGTVLGNVANMAVFDSKTNKYKNIAPKLPRTPMRASRRILSRALSKAMTERTPLRAPPMPTPSTATVAPTASTLGAATIPCALARAWTKVKVGVATTISVLWMGVRTTSPVALALIASKPTPVTTSQRDVRKS
jgi:hypothetical protein